MLKIEILDAKFHVLGMALLPDTRAGWSWVNQTLVNNFGTVNVPITRMGRPTQARIQADSGQIWGVTLQETLPVVGVGDLVTFPPGHIRMDRELAPRMHA